MRIAQIAPLVERVPPKKYGGTERVVSALTEELVKRGHEVTLFASGDSITKAKIVSVFPRSLAEAKVKDLYGVNPWTLLNVGLAYERHEEFDVIHDHCTPISMPVANSSKTPVVVTMHGPFSPENRKLYQNLKRPHIVTISNAQLTIPDINHAGTVHNGLPMTDYPFGAEPDDYLLYVGRLSIEKGVHFAIETAELLDIPLIMAAKLEISVDMPYFREYIEPKLSERIRWIGEVGADERNKLMSKALAFLHPVTWREPFGLTLIESMACGCPVIAFNLGSIPEIVKDKVTGYVVSGIDGMIEAVNNVHEIDRAACREHALKNFSVEKMADGYEAIYKTLTNKS